MGLPVARAERVYGGYVPSATFRLVLRDGRRAFMKATYPLPKTSHVEWGLEAEERVYRELSARIRPWAPIYHGSVRAQGWHAVVLEDLGPATVPPWTRALVRSAARDYAAFHRKNRGARLPRWLPKRVLGYFATQWAGVSAPAVAALSGRRAKEAQEWLDVCLPVLRSSAMRLAHARGTRTLLHLDTRSDNIRVGRRLRMFDWNFAQPGLPEIDVVAFVQSIVAEGGPSEDVFLDAYREVSPLDERVLASSASAIAGFFAKRAPLPPLVGLPRVRAWQRCQLKTSLAWASRALDLPEPLWLRSVKC